ncbi:MAG: hypothetical protein HRT87_09825 [Legionellales bacterium]|nr:hypothetical protein [Legionellales bacterium]
MTEFNITNETGSPIVFATLDDFTIAAAATKDVFAVANGNFAVGDIIDNSELQGLLDATDISIEDESSNVITDLFIIDDLLATGNTKLDFISITQAVDLDTLESNVATNNAKVTNATHTGEVTGSGTLTVDSTAISNKASVTAVAGMDILVDDSGTLKKVDADDFLSAGSGLNYLETATLDEGSIITPPQMANDVHDYNPTGFATCVMIRQSIQSNGKKITGFVAPAAGVNRIIAVNNISSSGRDIRFEHQDSNSSSANRLYLRDNGARTIRPNETAIFWYDHTSNGWRSYNRIG